MAKASHAQSLRLQLEIAGAAIGGLEAALGEAVLAGDAAVIAASREVLAEQRQHIEDLRAAPPLAEKAEAEALTVRQDKQAADRRRRLEAELKSLIRESILYSVHTTNQVSAFRRLVKQAAVILGLLFDSRHPKLEGLTRVLAATSLHRLCSRELSRLGLPAMSSEPLGSGLPAPGALPQPEYFNAPSRMPNLEGDIRALAAAILAALPEPQASEEPRPLPL
jgi:hypothetical protein